MPSQGRASPPLPTSNMLGTLRFALALSVGVAHLTGGTPFFSHWGVFAVFGFYVVSGYLMTLVLNDTYAFRFSTFALNRVLRLFPIYYMVAAATAVIVFASSQASAFHPAWTIQTRWLDLVGNGLIVPFEFYDAAFRLVPPAWSIGVELLNYLVLWAVGARSRASACALFFAALAYHLASYGAGAGWQDRYAPAYAALLPFSVGALLYFLQTSPQPVTRKLLRQVRAAAAVLWTGNLVLCGVAGGVRSAAFELFFYASLACLAAFLWSHLQLTRDCAATWWDKQLGDLAYPVFLTHWVVGFAVGQLVLGGQPRGLALFALSLLPTIGISYALSRWADRVIEPLRSRIRGTAPGPGGSTQALQQ